jgi:hypothetical protein
VLSRFPPFGHRLQLIRNTLEQALLLGGRQRQFVEGFRQLLAECVVFGPLLIPARLGGAQMLVGAFLRGTPEMLKASLAGLLDGIRDQQRDRRGLCEVSAAPLLHDGRDVVHVGLRGAAHCVDVGDAAVARLRKEQVGGGNDALADVGGDIGFHGEPARGQGGNKNRRKNSNKSNSMKIRTLITAQAGARNCAAL